MAFSSLPRLVLALALATFSLGLVSCASGPLYVEMKGKLPPIAKGDGRVFVYRPTAMGFGVRPSVKIDDQVVGTSKSLGFFYTDQKPGTHEISVFTEWKHKNTLTVTAGQPSYVECIIVPGLFVGHIIPNQVTAEVGEMNLQQCKQSSD